jgi:hypothetical protein
MCIGVLAGSASLLFSVHIHIFVQIFFIAFPFSNAAPESTNKDTSEFRSYEHLNGPISY